VRAWEVVLRRLPPPALELSSPSTKFGFTSGRRTSARGVVGEVGISGSFLATRLAFFGSENVD